MVQLVFITRLECKNTTYLQEFKTEKLMKSILLTINTIL